MDNPFFERPILNSPYGYPSRYWELDDSGHPTQQIIESRRPADFVTPVPKPRKRKGKAEQGSLALGDAEGLSDETQHYHTADHEYLYYKPFDDKKKVRVAGPFTVDSLSPHRVLGVDENDELIDGANDGRVENMSESDLHFAKPPIVEAIVDIDGDVAPGFDVGASEEASRVAFGDAYPKVRKRFSHVFSIALKPGESTGGMARREVQTMQFLHADGKQLVQLRAAGFSFNRLAPYSSFDEYLPEIQRTWDVYRAVAKPVMVQAVQLRYINRLFLPILIDDLLRESKASETAQTGTSAGRFGDFNSRGRGHALPSRLRQRRPIMRVINERSSVAP